MRKTLAAALVAFALPAFGADATKKIPADSAVFIEPMGTFDTAVAAAIIKKHVPVRIVDAKDKADYTLTCLGGSEKAGWAKTIFVSPLPSAHASVMLKGKDGTVVWAYSVDKGNAYHGEQSAAEAVAKHMKNEAVVEEKK